MSARVAPDGSRWKGSIGRTARAERNIPHSPRRERARVLNDNPRIIEGAGNAGCAARTHGLACEVKKHTSIVTTGTAGSRHSPRDGFTVSFVLSPVSMTS